MTACYTFRRVFKTRWFSRWANSAGLRDGVLVLAADEVRSGLVDADLGGGVLKKRVPLPGRGKRGGARVLIAVSDGDCAFFVYGFAKGATADVSRRELAAIRRLASELSKLGPWSIEKAVSARELEELRAHE